MISVKPQSKALNESPLAPSPVLALILLAILSALFFVIGAIIPTALQLATPNQYRAQVSAFSMFIVNLVGMGLGPTVVALITDFVFVDTLALRYSISIVGGLFAPLGALAFWSGTRSYRTHVTIAPKDVIVQHT